MVVTGVACYFATSGEPTRQALDQIRPSFLLLLALFDDKSLEYLLEFFQALVIEARRSVEPYLVE